MGAGGQQDIRLLFAVAAAADGAEQGKQEPWQQQSGSQNQLVMVGCLCPSPSPFPSHPPQAPPLPPHPDRDLLLLELNPRQPCTAVISSFRSSEAPGRAQDVPSTISKIHLNRAL